MPDPKKPEIIRPSDSPTSVETQRKDLAAQTAIAVGVAVMSTNPALALIAPLVGTALSSAIGFTRLAQIKKAESCLNRIKVITEDEGVDFEQKIADDVDAVYLLDRCLEKAADSESENKRELLAKIFSKCLTQTDINNAVVDQYLQLVSTLNEIQIEILSEAFLSDLPFSIFSLSEIMLRVRKSYSPQHFDWAVYTDYFIQTYLLDLERLDIIRFSYTPKVSPPETMELYLDPNHRFYNTERMSEFRNILISKIPSPGGYGLANHYAIFTFSGNILKSLAQ